MANKKVERRVLNRERLKEVKELRGLTYNDIASHEELDVDIRTLRRWVEQEEIPSHRLDALARVLDIDPEYLTDRIEQIAERWGMTLQEQQSIIKSFQAEEHPYWRKEARETEFYEIIKALLLVNNVDSKALEDLDRKEFAKLYLELNRETGKIIRKYFTPQGLGFIESEIDMPPEEEIVVLK